ncbi:conserved protein of unknown function [Tenacibaculum sp. 190130A14a]|uniref:Uncharacterized protein n=1 Tax=Tenacibaculum polynesiense TaxID=3137857 RepID=A0ABP1F249_9FLAO
MKKQELDLTKFESLETSNDILKGGFSQALSTGAGLDTNIIGALNLAKNCGATTNNCNGGNCVSGCGGGASSIQA